MEALVSGVGHCRTKIGGWWWNRCGWASRCVGRSKSRLALRSSLFSPFPSSAPSARDGGVIYLSKALHPSIGLTNAQAGVQ